ncbi:hypothetical protein KY285_010962 [Solanum tuberosum]|nr:hypothetical protein KY285_010962 [Solanum tuberosum]
MGYGPYNLHFSKFQLCKKIIEFCDYKSIPWSLVSFAGAVGATVRERWASGGQVSWWIKGHYPADFAGAREVRLIAVRDGFVSGASPEKMESLQFFV